MGETFKNDFSMAKSYPAKCINWNYMINNRCNYGLEPAKSIISYHNFATNQQNRLDAYPAESNRILLCNSICYLDIFITEDLKTECQL